MKRFSALLLLTFAFSIFAAGPVGKARPEGKKTEEGKEAPETKLPGNVVPGKVKVYKPEEAKGKVEVEPGKANRLTEPAIPGKSSGGTKARANESRPSDAAEVDLSHAPGALKSIPGGSKGRVTAEPGDGPVKFSDAFTKELNDGKKPASDLNKAASEEAKAVAEVKGGSASDSIGGKNNRFVQMKEKSSQAYGGKLEKTIKDIVESTDESMKKDVEMMVRLMVRMHARKHKNDPNQEALVAELEKNLKDFASLTKELAAKLKDDPKLAREMMRGLLTHYFRSPEKAGEFIASVKSWLNAPGISDAEKVQTIKGLAMVLSEHGNAFFKKFVEEGKTFEEALASADAKLGEFLQGKLTAEEIEELAKKCIPGATLRAAAAASARLVASH